VQEVLVDGRQLRFQNLVQKLDNLGITLHVASQEFSR
jgi:hypothetical protein